MDAAFNRSIKDRDIAMVQHRLLLSSGAVKSVEERWQVFEDANGKPVRAAGTCQDITERKHAELAMAALTEQTGRRERMFHTMLSSISDFAYIFDSEGRFMFANQPLLGLWGITLEQAVGKTFLDLGYPAGLAERLHRQVQQVFDSGKHVSDETPYVSPSGVEGSYEYIFSPAFSANGSVEFVVGSSRDITERKRAEAALRESETEFRTLAEAMPQIVWVARADGRNVYFSRQWTVYTGLSAEAGRDHGWSRPFHPEDQQRALDAWQRATAAASTYSVECRLRRADGEYRWWLLRGVPSLDGDGQIVKWFGTYTDVHDMKVAELDLSRANRELRRQTSELQVLLDLVPAMIWFKDTENNILRTNAAAAKAIGRTVEEMEGKSSLELYPEISAQIHGEDLEVIRSGIALFGMVQAVKVGTGREVWIQRDKVPFRDEEGNVVGIVSMAQDITERKRDQDALRDLNAELEGRVLARTTELKFARDEARTANKAKSAFLAAMSHEIRTPMNGVIGMIEVLHQTSLKGHQVEILDVIRESAFALLQIIEDILDFSKIEAGKLTVEHEPLELADTVEKACGMLDHLAVKQGVRMTVFIDPAIPGTLAGDAGRLRQVLVNLAGNAIKFSAGREQPGQVSVRVLLVERHAQAVTVELVVTDNGIGIEEAALARLFTPFSQADVSTTRRFGGTGLGLAITSMLVRLMDGTLAVQSMPGIGSTFTVRLRLVAPEGVTHAQPVYAPVQGLRCRIVGQDVPLAEDIAAYLGNSQVIVERSTDLAAAVTAGSSGPEVWLLLPGITAPDAAQLRAMSIGRSDAETRFIVLGWGKRRRPRLAAADLVMLDADALLRRTLIRALALVAGRVQEQTNGDDVDLPAPAQAPARQEAQLQGRLILVAEDNETNRIVILRQLALIGFAAEVAVDGRAALALWRTGDFALLLTDLHMPQMDGYALTAAIRAEETQGRRIPIIALTANALRDEERQCLAAGMDAYLTKPVRLAQLKASIEKWIGPCAQVPVALQGQTATSDAPVADLSILTALVGDDPTVIDEVLQAFRATIALSVLVLDQGTVPGSGQAVADAAHKLKSAARSIGALRLGDLCAQMEQVAEARRSGELAALLPLFHAESQAVLRFLDAR
ncbi:MAG: PAS domain S-box protein [Betaproteobacteria bacterium]